MPHVTYDTILHMSEICPVNSRKTVEENIVRKAQPPLEKGFTGGQAFAR